MQDLLGLGWELLKIFGGGLRSVAPVIGILLVFQLLILRQPLENEWEVIEHSPQEAAFLLESCAEKGIRHVALNPSTKLTRTQNPSGLVPIGSFTDYLRGG